MALAGDVHVEVVLEAPGSPPIPELVCPSISSGVGEPRSVRRPAAVARPQRPSRQGRPRLAPRRLHARCCHRPLPRGRRRRRRRQPRRRRPDLRFSHLIERPVRATAPTRRRGRPGASRRARGGGWRRGRRGDGVEHRAQRHPGRHPQPHERLGHAVVGQLVGADAPHRSQGALDGPDDLGDGDLLGRPGQPPAPLGASLAEWASPPLRSDRRMSSRNAGGIDSRVGQELALHRRTPGARRSAAASAVMARTA